MEPLIQKFKRAISKCEFTGRKIDPTFIVQPTVVFVLFMGVAMSSFKTLPGGYLNGKDFVSEVCLKHFPLVYPQP